MQFSPLLLCLSRIRLHLVILYRVGAILFETDILSMLSHTPHLALSFSFFVSLILSAPHLAFLGSHSHYATLAGTRPYISEYPDFMFSFYSAVCPIYNSSLPLFRPFLLRITGWWSFVSKLWDDDDGRRGL